MDDIQALLGTPGMQTLVQLAPVVGLASWLVLSLILWRGGFDDLFERFVHRRWTARQRWATALMIPWRAAMLTAAAAIGAGFTTLGLLINIAVLLNIVRVGKVLLSG